MAAAVAAALDEGHHLVVEAGTGIGKSFGYLVPAILDVTREPAQKKPTEKQPKRRILLSTHTISLQEQLLAKDIPFLNSVIPREFVAILGKGRGNYLSLRRLDLALGRAASLFEGDEELAALRQLRDWSRDTQDGSKSDLAIRPPGSVWTEVASDSGNCLGRECPTHQRCFYYAARRRLQNAQLLIVNHALFFSDLALRRAGVSILPDYQAVVFDEAHTIESVAADHLGLGVTSGQVEYALTRLYNDRTNKGLLRHHDLVDAQREVLDCHHQAADFFSELLEWKNQSANKNGRARAAGIVENRLSPALLKLARIVRTAGGKVGDRSQRQDFSAAHDRLLALASEIDQWVSQAVPGSVYWMESTWSRRGQSRVTLSAAPIEMGPVLRETLFKKTRSVVLTSATLSVGGDESFNFFRSRIGLDDGRSLRLGSPFDFRSQGEADPGRRHAGPEQGERSVRTSLR